MSFVEARAARAAATSPDGARRAGLRTAGTLIFGAGGLLSVAGTSRNPDQAGGFSSRPWPHARGGGLRMSIAFGMLCVVQGSTVSAARRVSARVR